MDQGFGRMSCWLYRGLIGIVTVGFLLTVRTLCLDALPENDLWWMMPTLSFYVEGKSWSEIFLFLLSPAPIGFGQPVLKAYLFGVTSLWGPNLSALTAVSVMIHLANSAWLYRLSRQTGLSATVSLLAALTYLTAFAHFHAVLWPTAFQHLIAVFTILGTCSAYFSTESRLASGERAGGWYGMTLFWALLASLQRSAMVAPFMILAHLFLVPGSAASRQARFDRWLPLWVLSVLYPAFSLAFVGDVIINDAIVQWALPGGVKFAGMLLLAGAVLFGVRSLLRFKRTTAQQRWFWGGGIALGTAFWLMLTLQDFRQLLLPYNTLSPLISTLAAFLDPLRVALTTDSSEAYHYIPAMISGWALLLACGSLWLFGVAFLRRKPQLALWGVWYVVALVHLLHQYTSFPPVTPSRYFIYMTPVFSILFASSLVFWITRLVRQARGSLLLRDGLLVVLFLGLALPNLAAIRVESFRGKLANTYLLYDDLRTAALIRADLEAQGQLQKITPDQLAVGDVLEMPHRELAPGHSPVNPATFSSFRLVLGETLNNPAMQQVQVNPEDVSEKANVYWVAEGRLTNNSGQWVEPFAERVALGLERMQAGEFEQAEALFRQALEVRPFLLRYLLASAELSDLRWVTGGEDLRSWVHRIGDRYARWSQVTIPKQERIRTVMDREIWDMVTALFLMSYLQAEKGDLEAAKQWLAQVRFLESEPDLLVRELGRLELVRTDGKLQRYLTLFQDPTFFQEPMPWRKDDYGLGRFLVRLIWQWNVSSQWDKSLGITL